MVFTYKVHVDAIDFSWAGGYTYERSLLLDAAVSLSNSSVIKSIVTAEIFNHPKADMVIDESEDIAQGESIEITDMYSEGGASASNIIFEGMVFGKGENYPFELNVENRGREMFSQRPSATSSGRSDQILEDQRSNECDYITNGTLSAGTAMGDRVYNGDKTLFESWFNLALFQGWLLYLLSEGAVNFDAGDTDTGVTITQASNIWAFKRGRARQFFTKVMVTGEINTDGTRASGTASGTADDITNYGTNVFKHTDATLTTALCGTAATNILGVLDNDPILVQFMYQDASIGFIQPGEYITLSYDLDGVIEVESQTFIVTKLIYDTVSGVGQIWAMSQMSYSFKNTDYQQRLIEENNHLIEQNRTNITPTLSYNHYIKLSYTVASGTAGGAFTLGAWRTRPLNTEDHDIGSHCSLAANQFILDAGTYYVRGKTNGFYVDRHTCKIYNITDAADELIGTPAQCASGTGFGGTWSTISGLLTVGATKTLELQGQCQTTRAADGMGLAATFGVVEIHAVLELWKVG